MPLPRGDDGGRSAGRADETTPLAPTASDGSTPPKRRPAAAQQQQGSRQAAAEETVEKKMSKAVKLGIYVAGA